MTTIEHGTNTSILTSFGHSNARVNDSERVVGLVWDNMDKEFRLGIQLALSVSPSNLILSSAWIIKLIQNVSKTINQILETPI